MNRNIRLMILVAVFCASTVDCEGQQSQSPTPNQPPAQGNGNPNNGQPNTVAPPGNNNGKNGQPQSSPPGVPGTSTPPGTPAPWSSAPPNPQWTSAPPTGAPNNGGTPAPGPNPNQPGTPPPPVHNQPGTTPPWQNNQGQGGTGQPTNPPGPTPPGQQSPQPNQTPQGQGIQVTQTPENNQGNNQGNNNNQSNQPQEPANPSQTPVARDAEKASSSSKADATTASTSDSSSGLSSGAIAGIVIVVIALLGGVAAFVLRQRTKNAQSAKDLEEDFSPSTTTASNFEQSNYAKYQASEPVKHRFDSPPPMLATYSKPVSPGPVVPTPPSMHTAPVVSLDIDDEETLRSPSVERRSNGTYENDYFIESHRSSQDDSVRSSYEMRQVDGAKDAATGNGGAAHWMDAMDDGSFSHSERDSYLQSDSFLDRNSARSRLSEDSNASYLV